MRDAELREAGQQAAPDEGEPLDDIGRLGVLGGGGDPAVQIIDHREEALEELARALLELLRGRGLEALDRRLDLRMGVVGSRVGLLELGVLLREECGELLDVRLERRDVVAAGQPELDGRGAEHRPACLRFEVRDVGRPRQRAAVADVGEAHRAVLAALARRAERGRRAVGERELLAVAAHARLRAVRGEARVVEQVASELDLVE